MLTQEEIKEGNEKIAKFLGWFQEEIGVKGTWFVIDGSAQYVAYSVHNNYPHRDLPFHRDWNYLMKAVTKVEDLGLCLHTSNYCKAKDVKNNLAAHIGFNMLDSYYCDISGSITEDTNGNNTTRYFQIQRMDMERLESVFRTIVMFVDAYDDKTIRIINVSDGEITRIERKSEDHD
jgi:hypothetical protein